MATTVNKRNNVSIGLSGRQLYAHDQRRVFELSRPPRGVSQEI